MGKIMITEQPAAFAAEEILKTYRGGTVGIVGENDGLIKELTKTENPIHILRGGDAPAAHIRLIIGTGERQDINAAKRMANDRRLMLLPAKPERFSFSGISINGYQISYNKLPETIIIDKNTLRLSKPEIYVSLFGLLTDVCDALSGGYGKEETLLELKALLYEAVADGTDDVSAVEILQKGAAALRCSGCSGVTEILSVLPFPRQRNILPEERAFFDFFCSYLLNTLLLQFTNKEINGIVIGTDRVRIREVFSAFRMPPKKMPAAGRAGFVKDGPLTREKLCAIAGKLYKISDFADCRRPDIGMAWDQILFAAELTDWDGWSFRLAADGSVEGIRRYGTKSQRGRILV